ncbi:MAG: CPBP family intramembrane glutamic endopeptidase [Planctomycetota bacterium]
MVVGSVAVLVAFVFASERLPWTRWHERWNFANQALMIALAMGPICFGLVRGREYGLRVGDWRRRVAVGLGLVAVVLLPAVVVGGMTGGLSWDPQLTRYPIATPLFQLVFVAFGEEFFFRGLCQSELNRAWGRRMRLGRTRFGWGVLTIALVFGVGHLLNPWWGGGDGVSWLGLFSAGGFALAAGLLRERFDGLVVPVILHAGVNFYFVWIDGTPTSDWVYAGSLVLVYGLIVLWLAIEGRGDSSEAGAMAGGAGADERSSVA